MKYFRMTFSDSAAATKEVWRRQVEADCELSNFNTSASGMDASIWTESEEGEVLLRRVLKDLGLVYEEGEKQQVRTWLDGMR